MTKAELRAKALLARGAGGDQGALDLRLIAALAPHAGQVLAAYWPMRGEADPRPAAALHDGPLCLPAVIARGTALQFRQWRDEPLEGGLYGTLHPPATAPVLRPRVVIVPLAAFDRRGSRLGYGGGFYDRTLAALRASGDVTAIGLAYAVQELAAIPAEPFDQPLDLIVTDRELIHPFP